MQTSKPLRTLEQSIEQNLAERRPLILENIDLEFLIFFLSDRFAPNRKFIFCVDDSSLRSSRQLRKHPRCLFLDHWPLSPYESTETNWSDMEEQWSVGRRLAKGDFQFLFLHPAQLPRKFPTRHFWDSSELSLKKDEYFPPDDLAQALEELGYRSDFEVSGPATYARRGEVFDFVTADGDFYRLRYFDDQIEKMSRLQGDRIASDSLEVISLGPSLASLLYEESYQKKLREQLPSPSHLEREKYERRRAFFQSVEEKRFDPLSYHAWSLGLEESISLYQLLDELPKEQEVVWLLQDPKQRQSDLEKFINQIEEEFLFHQNEAQSRNFFPEAKHFFSFAEIQDQFSHLLKRSSSTITFATLGLSQWFHLQTGEVISPKKEGMGQQVWEHLQELQGVKLTYAFPKEEAELLPEILEQIKEISLEQITLSDFSPNESVFFPGDDWFILSLKEFFSLRLPPKARVRSKVKSQNQRTEFFSESLSSLSVGDYLVHAQHGVGRYEGIQQLSFGPQTTDFLILRYKDDDKIYVPVHKFELISKFADSSTAVALESLRTKKFELEKQKARKSVKKLAFDLLALQAKRANSQGFAFSGPTVDYLEFCHQFPYRETQDQLSAMEQIVDDMTSGQPMDRLVCGDVGFGKTELAMRAAFLAAQDGKQVGVLVPTTILCLQHYHSFVERFKQTPFRIEFVSRFKSTAAAKQVLQDLEDGKIDIIIGTHQLLSSKTKFKDLGLLIIDEEHRFGVAHKEKLKLMQANVANLTLTATPIPRTLNFSLMGLKELSLIQTPPSGRQSVESYVVRQDPVTMHKAIEKELKRGGQVYFIHNRVQDIESIQIDLEKRFADQGIKIGLAHGQMPSDKLEKIIEDFYQRKLHLLIATTIVESGIDVPQANTMIINNAHMFGLAQLHQLRGRVGRSSEKAYCYFVIPDESKLSDVSLKRIEAVKKYASLGSGFAIANSDLDIRGAGEILGAEQSGHMERMGMELYLEILQEAMDELKRESLNESAMPVWNVDFQGYLPAYISESYIPKESLRLKYYKKLSLCAHREELEALRDELSFRFGDFPEELQNLFDLMKLKIRAKLYGIESISLQKSEIKITFHKGFMEMKPEFSQTLVQNMLEHPGVYKLTQDFSLIKGSGKNSNKPMTFKSLEDLLLSLPTPPKF